MQTAVRRIADCPELARRHQAQHAPQQGDAKAGVNQGHTRIPLEQDAARGEHVVHPQGQPFDLHRLTARHQGGDRFGFGRIDRDRTLFTAEGQQHGLAAIGTGWQDDAPNLIAQLGEALEG